MSGPVGGVIRGRTIELESDSGLDDGERIEVVIRRVPQAPGKEVRSSAGALAHMPPDYFDDLDEIIRSRQDWPFREAPE